VKNVVRPDVPGPAAAAREPLRVCHLAYTFYETDNRVMRYAETLAQRGDRVDVIALRRAGGDTPASGVVRVFRIQRRSVNEKAAWTYLLKLLWFCCKSFVVLSVLQLRRRYDVVHIHNVPDFLVFAALLPKLMGATIILDIHDILPELYAGKFGSEGKSLVFRTLTFVERLSCRFADHVIIANHLWHEKLVQRSVSREKCSTIMNYPDLTLFHPREEGATTAVDSGFVVLYPGSLNYHQGVDIAVRAFARACDRMPGAEFHIHGEGPARSELEALIRDLGVGDRIKLRPRVPLIDVCRLMASANVGIVPKRAEGFGNEAFSTKILEFMACGVPVIVSRTRIDDFYFDDSLVRFFSPGEEAELTSALVWMFDGRDSHSEWKLRAREFAIRNSWQARVSEYINLVDGPRTRRGTNSVTALSRL
jgi:glycosyltransferase involved in cell wall biosynthesis